MMKTELILVTQEFIKTLVDESTEAISTVKQRLFWYSVSINDVVILYDWRRNDGNGDNSGHVRVYEYDGVIGTIGH